jgi:hypothetical protein
MALIMTRWNNFGLFNVDEISPKLRKPTAHRPQHLPGFRQIWGYVKDRKVRLPTHKSGGRHLILEKQRNQSRK